MIISEEPNIYGDIQIYAHCEGCGMEYELDPETGVLTRWHDAVGLETQTTLQGPYNWDEIVQSHDDCPEMNDE